MSTTAPSAPTLPDPQTAHNFLTERVDARVFFDKLASDYGVSPRNDVEAHELMTIRGRLRMAKQSHLAKQAAAANSPFGAALMDLDQELTLHGIDVGTKQAADQEFELAVRGAARQLSTDPDIFNAVLAVKSAEAQELAQRYGINPRQQAAA